MFLKKNLGKSLLFLHTSPTCIKVGIRRHFTVGQLSPGVGVKMEFRINV